MKVRETVRGVAWRHETIARARKIDFMIARTVETWWIMIQDIGQMFWCFSRMC
jgi:hypothetical protein